MNKNNIALSDIILLDSAKLLGCVIGLLAGNGEIYACKDNLYLIEFGSIIKFSHQIESENSGELR